MNKKQNKNKQNEKKERKEKFNNEAVTRNLILARIFKSQQRNWSLDLTNFILDEMLKLGTKKIVIIIR